MTTLADELWKGEVQQEQCRHRLYDELLEPLINRIFYLKEACSEHYYIYKVPKTAHHDAAQQRTYYIQKECALHLKSQLYERGFYARTMDNHSALFISWLPSLLGEVKLSQQKQKLKVDAEQRKKERQQREVEAIEYATNERIAIIPPKKPSPYIELDGSKSDLENRIALTTFLLQNK